MSTEGPVAKIGVEVDATKAVAGLNQVADAAKEAFDQVEKEATKGKKGMDDIPKGALPASQTLDRATRSMVQSIERTTAAFSAGSKSSSDYYRVLAEQRGIDPKLLEPYLAALDKVAPKQKAVTEAVSATVPVMQKYEMSAKATAAAMRQVPAQFTDIVVGLQGGQNPLTVLLQQGGQLKDVFGGVGAAARALGTYIVGLISPITIAAASAATLGVAFYQGRKEAEEFNKSLILTGNYAGTTSGALAVMADNMSSMSGVTKGAAAEALNALVATGRIGAGQLEKFASVAYESNKRTGDSLADIAANFVALEKDPVDASLKLNSTMHYLTLEVYNQIKALDEQGKSAEAAAAAQRAYADALDTRNKALTENLGTLARAWESVSKMAKNAWDSMLDIGRQESPETKTKTLTERLAQAQKDLAEASSDGTATGGARASFLRKQIEALQAQLAPLEETARLKERAAQATSQEARDVELRAKFDSTLYGRETNAAKMKKELTAAENEYGAAVKRGIISQKEYAELQEFIRKKYTDKGLVSKAAELDKARAGLDIQKIQLAMSAQADAYANGEKLLEANRAAGLVADADYFAKKQEYLELNTKNQAAALDAEIEREQKRKAIGNNATEIALNQIDIDKKVMELQSKKKKVLADAAAASEVLAVQEASAAKKITSAYVEADAAAQNYLQTVQRGYERNLAGLSRGDEFRNKTAARGQIEDKYSNLRDEALSKFRTSGMTQQDDEIYFKRMQQLKEALKNELDAFDQHYEDVKKAEADWATGASRSLENYVDMSKNTAAQSAKFFTDAFSNMENALVDFVKTGKLDFASLADGIISDLIRIKIQKDITGPLADSMNKGGKDFFSALFNANGNAFGSSGVHAFANGGTFTNKVYSDPTAFRFANGGGFALGVMAEAGPEAVMPLKRGPDGKLGVQATGGGSGVVVNQPIVINANNASAETVGQIRSLMPSLIAENKRVIEGVIRQAISSKGGRALV